MKEKILGMIGLARRAGLVSAGESKCSHSIKSGAARLVIIASDASDNTKKSIIDSCRYYNAECVEAASKDELGKYSGTGSVSAVSINSDNFAKAILDRFNEMTESLRKDKKG